MYLFLLENIALRYCDQKMWSDIARLHIIYDQILRPNIEHILWSDTVTKYCGPPYIVLLWPNVYIMYVVIRIHNYMHNNI